jgi:hypothetical protein
MAIVHPRRRHRFSPTSARDSSTRVEPGTVVPYDAAARFELIGEPGNVVQEVVNIDPDGVFVAAAIGYGFLEKRTSPLTLNLDKPKDDIIPADIKLHELPQSALIEGFRVHPRSETIVFEGDVSEDPSTAPANWQYSDQAVTPELIDKAFEFIRPTHDVSFLFSMVDSSSGREMQNEPEHNIAALGNSTGERPFRRLARPLAFMPRSTIRMQVIERTPDVRGSLFVALYGYKIVLSSMCSEVAAKQLIDAAMQTPGVIASERPLPFDYVARFELTGRPGNELESEIPVSAEGQFVATAIGYGLAAEAGDVPIDRSSIPDTLVSGDPKDPDITLADLPLAALPADALHDGLRIRPDYLRIAVDPAGNLRTLKLSLVNRIFEHLNDPNDVSFLYSISDTGIGRDWQNRPIYNVAGLGIANGLRPFKYLERPRVFPPRSTIRVDVEEHSGRGTLFIAFQGYKSIGVPTLGGRS